MYFAAFCLYVTTACFFQVVVVFKQRFQWIGLIVGGTLFLINQIVYFMEKQG
ncbi:DUF4052 family protein [Bacillus pacificus]